MEREGLARLTVLHKLADLVPIITFFISGFREYSSTRVRTKRCTAASAPVARTTAVTAGAADQRRTPSLSGFAQCTHRAALAAAAFVASAEAAPCIRLQRQPPRDLPLSRSSAHEKVNDLLLLLQLLLLLRRLLRLLLRLRLLLLLLLLLLRLRLRRKPPRDLPLDRSSAQEKVNDLLLLLLRLLLLLLLLLRLQLLPLRHHGQG